MRPNPFKSKEMRRQPKCLPALLAAVLLLAACVRRTRLSIVVHTSNPDITRLFNLVYAPTAR